MCNGTGFCTAPAPVASAFSVFRAVCVCVFSWSSSSDATTDTQTRSWSRQDQVRMPPMAQQLRHGSPWGSLVLRAASSMSTSSSSTPHQVCAPHIPPLLCFLRMQSHECPVSQDPAAAAVHISRAECTDMQPPRELRCILLIKQAQRMPGGLMTGPQERQRRIPQAACSAYTNAISSLCYQQHPRLPYGACRAAGRQGSTESTGGIVQPESSGPHHTSSCHSTLQRTRRVGGCRGFDVQKAHSAGLFQYMCP